MTKEERLKLQIAACKVRMGVIESTHGAKAGHPGGSLSNPTAEHFLPLLYVLGAWNGDEPVTIPIDGLEMASLSMLSVQVG